MTGYSRPAKSVFRRSTGGAAAACGSARPRRSRTSRGQSAVEFALMAVLAIIIMTVGIQFALIGQAALALSQGSSVLARYAAVNPGTVGPNGTVALTAPMKQLLSSSILTNSGGDLTVTIASYSGTTTNTTDTPVQTDRLVIRLSYNAKSKIALPNPFLGIVTFPTTLSASDSQMYE